MLIITPSFAQTVQELKSEKVESHKRIAEAEDGFFSGSVDTHSCWKNVMLTDAQHSTHSGTGAVDTKNEIGSFVEVVFEAQISGLHRISVRYTHIKPDPRPAQLFINGVLSVENFEMPQSEALPAWRTKSTQIRLEKGKNNIRLSALNDGGLPNIDSFKVRQLEEDSSAQFPFIKILEAENGKFTGTVDHHSCWEFIALVEADHSAPTGKGFVDTKNETGSFVEVRIHSKTKGNFNLLVRYVHNKTDERPASLSVNGKTANPFINFPPTGAWTVWKTVKTMIQLEGGNNVIRLTALRDQGLANIDHFEFIEMD